jgi:hypothetical protein
MSRYKCWLYYHVLLALLIVGGLRLFWAVRSMYRSYRDIDWVDRDDKNKGSP